MKVSDIEQENGGGTWFLIECESARANSFKHWCYRADGDNLPKEAKDLLAMEFSDTPEGEEVKITKAWLTPEEILAVEDSY